MCLVKDNTQHSQLQPVRRNCPANLYSSPATGSKPKETPVAKLDCPIVPELSVHPRTW